MQRKVETISSFCWDSLREKWKEKFGEDVRIVDNGAANIDLNVRCKGQFSPSDAEEFAIKILQASRIAMLSPVNGAKVVYPKSSRNRI